MVTTEQRSRSEIPVDDRWDLSAIYATLDDWNADIERIRADLPKLAEMQGTLDQGADRLLAALTLDDAIGERLTRVYSYAGLWKDEDNANAEAVAAHDRAVTLSVEASQVSSYLQPEILALPDGTVDRYLEEQPGLAVYRHVLESLLRQREHVLSAEQERLLAAAAEMAMAPGQIFSMLNNADLTYGTITDESGNTVPLTKGSYQRFLESRSRDVRRQAFEGMHQEYLDHRNTLAATYAASVKSDIFYARVHKYDSALAAALEPNNIPVAVYDNLVEVVNRRLPVLHRYIALRKRILGLDDLHVYDLYVPIVPEIDREFTYEAATETVAKALSPLGEDYLQVLGGAFDSRWVDVYENRGKTSGAYSWGVYGVHPFILLNWSGRLNDVFTLAHEVGHAMHSHYSSTTQPFTYSHYTLFVAEVASTVNEMLMTDALRRQTDDRAFEMYLVNHALEDFRGTLFRQTMFAEFERWSHEYVEAGGTLTPDALNGKYGELCGRYYGPDVAITDFVAGEWSRVPHFYRAFYVYQYATGISAAAALSRQIIEDGEPARKRYRTFLSGGSSKYSLDLLRDAGVDMTTAQPIERALDAFEALVDELERLIQ
jgi:oligoendopeptidase F